MKFVYEDYIIFPIPIEISYRILQIVHGRKLMHFLWFLWQSRNFYSEIISFYKVN